MEPQIVHFDATTRRKEKMRQKATSDQERRTGAAASSPAPAPAASSVVGPPAITPPKPAAAPAPQPAPTPAPAPVQAAPAPAPAPQPAATPAASAPPTASMSPQELESFLVEFVVEQTGYPEEMVEMDADLEADLGIDSIKKAQLFGELAEHFDVSAVSHEELSLDDFPTLRHVMEFLQNLPGQSAGAAQPAAAAPAPTPAPAPAPAPAATTNGHHTAAAPAPAPTPAPAPAPTPAPAPAPTPAPAAAAPAQPAAAPAADGPALVDGKPLDEFLVDFVVEQTGYPAEMVELDADLEADLGIDSIKKAQLFGELAEYFEVSVSAEDDLSLDDFPTLRHVMNFLEGTPVRQPGSSPAPSAPAAPAPAPQAAAPAPAPAPTAPTPAPVAPAPVAPAPVQNAAPAPAPAAPQPAAAPAPAAPSNGSLNGHDTAASGGESLDDLEGFLINFVVEQTGYPPEMVEMDADLEADLGIDSIKKAQLFGELAEYFEVTVSADDDLSLDDFPTLRHVMQFLQGVPRKTPV